MDNREHIYVIVPTRSGWVTDSIASFFAHAVHLSYAEGAKRKFTVSTLGKIDGYAAVRNRAAQLFLQSDADRLWFIDNDTIFPEDIFELPEVDGDIVTLPYPFVGTMTPAICNYMDLNDFSKGMEDVVPGRDGIADVNGTGLGCTLIRRKVLEDPKMYYQTTYMTSDGKMKDLKDDPTEPPPIFCFKRKPNGFWEMGEDYDFCIRAKRLGYSIKIRMKSICGHLKTIDLKDAFERTERALAGRRADTKTYAL